MKRLLTIVLVLLLTIMVGVATAGSKKDVVKYEVKVEIVYNSLTPDEMGKVMKEIAEDHAGACTVKFNVKKLGNAGGFVVRDSVIGTTDPNINATWNTGTATWGLCIDKNGNLVPCDD